MSALTTDTSHTLKCVGKSERMCCHLRRHQQVHREHGTKERSYVTERPDVNLNESELKYSFCVNSDVNSVQKSCRKLMETHPDTVLMPVLFPNPARVAVEQQVTADPVPAVIPSLCGHSRHLHLLLEVHLEPGLLVSHHGRPTSCSWGIAEKYRQRVSIKHRYCRSAVDCCGFYTQLHLGSECSNV